MPMNTLEIFSSVWKNIEKFLKKSQMNAMFSIFHFFAENLVFKKFIPK
jgi:hypothetical protein